MSIYGQIQGSNDLVNQRLLGEINLDGFLVSHTKDDILWQGTQQSEVESKLKKQCAEFRRIALDRRSTASDERGPSERDTEIAIDELKKELEAPEMVDQISLEDVPPAEVVAASKKKITKKVSPKVPTYEAILPDQNQKIRIYLEDDMSTNDPYIVVQSTEADMLLVIINCEHPHWSLLVDSRDVLNYLRHCVFDGLAEWKARQKTSKIDPDTVRQLKDGFLRVEMMIEQHETLDGDTADG